MADFNNSGSNKRRRPRRKADSDQQEASNELPQQNKDAALRERKNNCWISVENLVCNFTGDNIIRTTNLWDGRKVLIEKANKLLNDPLFILQKLRNSIEPSIMENTRVKTLLKEVELTLKLSKNTVPVQDSTDEINSKSKNPVPIQDYTDGINDLDEGIQVTREELQFLSEQIKQENAIGDLKMQSLMAARTFVTVSRMLSKVEKSCCITMSEMMSTENPVQEQFLQREDKQLVLQFRPAPDSIQTNQSGKTDDVHNSEMINQEELVVEVDSLAFVGVRPEKLILKMQRDQKMDASLGSIDPEYLDKILSNDVPGSSDAKQMKST